MESDVLQEEVELVLSKEEVECEDIQRDEPHQHSRMIHHPFSQQGISHEIIGLDEHDHDVEESHDQEMQFYGFGSEWHQDEGEHQHHHLKKHQWQPGLTSSADRVKLNSTRQMKESMDHPNEIPHSIGSLRHLHEHHPEQEHVEYIDDTTVLEELAMQQAEEEEMARQGGASHPARFVPSGRLIQDHEGAEAGLAAGQIVLDEQGKLFTLILSPDAPDKFILEEVEQGIAGAPSRFVDEEEVVSDGLEQHVEDLTALPPEDEMQDQSNELYEMYRPGKKAATTTTCHVCGVHLKYPSKIMAHMRTHTGEKPFECGFCGKRFTQRTPWRMHERKHRNELAFPCTFYGCTKAFVSNALRNAHELTHQGRSRRGPPRPHLKPEKRQTFTPSHDNPITSNRPLIQNVVEDDDRAFVRRLMVDSAVFADDDEGIQPRLVVLEPSFFDQPVKTKPLSSAASKRLDDVIAAVAEGRPVECLQDSGGKKDRRSAPQRMPPMVAECTVCGLIIKHPSRIAAHIRTHRGEKPFGCSFCGLRVSTSNALHIHIGRHHVEGERPFACTWECGRRFVSLSARNEHEKVVHIGKKRYECLVNGCGRLFSRRYNLVQHRNRDHGIPMSGHSEERYFGQADAGILPLMPNSGRETHPEDDDFLQQGYTLSEEVAFDDAVEEFNIELER